MSVLGSLIFCTDCGNLLRESTGNANAILHCDICGTRNKDTIPQTTVSESKASSFPSSLRAKRSAVQTLSAEDRKTEAVIDKTCPDCARTEMFYTTVQLRSADEGSTVFYRCVCGFKYANSVFHVRLDANNQQGNLQQLMEDGCTKSGKKGSIFEERLYK
ncbi:unnamed protein product [Penicillium salamii]|nr:unnamed protein product [Penicillium salamii]CAG8314671.1 unnamed protein product [Penicillium salamii]CAG8408963.1 unnamed protein product [Penicillium salamii]